jgi:hypothetical protein
MNTNQQTSQTETSAESRQEPLPEWFDDRHVQERIARLIAKAAEAATRPVTP